MNEQAWIEWCQKQLADMSRRLQRQGYHPGRIEYLLFASPEFRRHWDRFQGKIRQVMDGMATHPDGYHHYDAFSLAKMDLLQYTNHHRAHFLDLQLAEPA